MRLENLDLNLLVALDALLQERSVTRAAERLGLSQPTLSASLARLRRHFDDELLYRSGNTYHLTPLAVSLTGRTSSALDEVARIFASQAAPDVRASTREFVVVCSDYTSAIFGAKLSAMLSREAPAARLHLRQSNPGLFGDDVARLRSVDAVIIPHGFLHDLPHLDLYEDEWVCLVATDNESVGERLTLADLSRLPWVVTSHGTTYSTTSVLQLAAQGVSVTVQTAVDNFLAVPHMIAGTNRIALVHRRLSRMLGSIPGIRVMECPLDTGPLVEALWWHPDYERDSEHVWLRERIAEIIAEDQAAQGS